MRDMNIRTAVASAVVAVMLILSLLSFALAAATADASRTIDPQVVAPGGEVNITVVFQNLLNVTKAFALKEVIPDGWGSTRGVDNATFKLGPPPEWAWLEGVGAGDTRTVTYTLTVPMGASPGEYVINGTVTGNNVTNAVGGDTTITVSAGALYVLTMAANPGAGGTATDLTGGSPYAENTEVSIQAVAAGGYHFLNWSAPAGAFGNATAATTTFTMPAQNVTVTANFELVGPPVYPTVTTLAATGVLTTVAALNMNYTVGTYSPVDVRFAYRKSAESTWSYTNWESKSTSGTYAATLSGLASSTNYDFKAQLKYDDTVIEGTTLQFTTATPSPPPPSGGCFIATAAYGTPAAKQIDVLREFRDTVLLKSTVGSAFANLYYRTSPPIADIIASNEVLRAVVRELLIDPIVWVVEATGGAWRN